MNKIDLSAFQIRLREAGPTFDLHRFDTDLALVLGIEVPDDYAQRKAEEDGRKIPVSPLEAYSMGRKLVALLGDGWTWSVTDSGEQSDAAVWQEGSDQKWRAEGAGPIALRIAALDAMASRST